MTRSGTTTLTCVGIFTIAVGLGIASAQTSRSKPDAQRPPAPATKAAGQQPATQPINDQQFVPQAAMANMGEIQLGHLAVKKAKNPDVKKFGQMMIDDHVKAQNELAEAASGAGIQWPKQLDDTHRQLQYRLSTLNNEQFDREYMKAMIDGHREVEKMLASRPSAVAKSDDSALAAKVNQWAGKTLPAVRAHLQQAEQISSTLK